MSKRFPTEDLVLAKEQEVHFRAKIHAAWKAYHCGDYSSEQYLNRCAEIMVEAYNGGWTKDGNVKKDATPDE